MLCYVIMLIMVISCIYYIHSYIKVYNAEQQEIKQIDAILLDWTKQLNNTETTLFYEGNNDDSNNIKDNLDEYNKGVQERYNEYSDMNDVDKVNDTSAIDSNNKSKDLDVADCILIIPSIDLKKYVYTGKQREVHLEQYELITATDDMKYQNGGNYIICGHYSKLYGHSLNRLKEITRSDDVIIWKNNKKTKYKVSSITYVNMNNTEQYCKQSKEQQITIISCAKYEGANKYIVVKCEAAE